MEEKAIGRSREPTFLGHAHFEALLQPAVLAAIPGYLVDDTVFVTVTCIHHVFLDAAPEEALNLRAGGVSLKQDAGDTNISQTIQVALGLTQSVLFVAGVLGND